MHCRHRPVRLCRAAPRSAAWRVLARAGGIARAAGAAQACSAAAHAAVASNRQRCAARLRRARLRRALRRRRRLPHARTQTNKQTGTLRSTRRRPTARSCSRRSTSSCRMRRRWSACVRRAAQWAPAQPAAQRHPETAPPALGRPQDAHASRRRGRCGRVSGAMCAAHRTPATSSASSLRRCTTGGSTRRARWRRSRCGHAATMSACVDRSNRTVTHRHRPGSAGVPVSTVGRSVCPTACTGVGRCGACCGSA